MDRDMGMVIDTDIDRGRCPIGIFNSSSPLATNSTSQYS